MATATPKSAPRKMKIQTGPWLRLLSRKMRAAEAMIIRQKARQRLAAIPQYQTIPISTPTERAYLVPVIRALTITPLDSVTAAVVIPIIPPN